MADAVGYGAATIAILCFGSNFVVTKSYKTGDGMFFQWVMAMGIFTVGLVTFLIQCKVDCTSDNGISCWTSDTKECPTFQPLAMLGGVIWCTGNILTVPIIKTVGLSLGLLTWGLVSMLVGWATNRFGLLGLTATDVSKPSLNDAGVIIAVLGLIVFAFVKPELSGKPAKRADLLDHDQELGWDLPTKPMMESLNSDHHQLVDADGDDDEEEGSFFDKLSPASKTIFGFGASTVAGICYGNNFNPPAYIVAHVQNYPGATTDLKDYIFSHFTGILLASTMYLLGYAIFMRNQPKVFPQVIVPGFFSGVVWAMAQVSWFFAGSFLSQAIAFPLISIGPGLIGALWGVFVFREITGKRNYVLVVLAFAFISTAAALIALSK